jgi:hypothetical protein
MKISKWFKFYFNIIPFKILLLYFIYSPHGLRKGFYNVFTKAKEDTDIHITQALYGTVLIEKKEMNSKQRRQTPL